MTTNVPRGSATIYQFPARGRFARASEHDVRPVAQTAPRVSYDAWYHDEAVAAEGGVRKN